MGKIFYYFGIGYIGIQWQMLYIYHLWFAYRYEQSYVNILVPWKKCYYSCLKHPDKSCLIYLIKPKKWNKESEMKNIYNCSPLSMLLLTYLLDYRIKINLISISRLRILSKLVIKNFKLFLASTIYFSKVSDWLTYNMYRIYRIAVKNYNNKSHSKSSCYNQAASRQKYGKCGGCCLEWFSAS